MKILKIKGETGIFQVFDMEKCFDKEGIINTLHTMYTILEGEISDKDYLL